jgi:uncharacterized membrane protein YphA (DoxX/SURF4 family)
MAGIPKKVKAVLFPPVSTKVMAMVAFVIEVLGVVCLIMGIVSDAIQKVLGLDVLVWFFMAIAFFIYGLWWWLTAYFAAKE